MSLTDRPEPQLVGFSHDLKPDFTLEVQHVYRVTTRVRKRRRCRQNQPIKSQQKDGKRCGGGYESWRVQRRVKCSQQNEVKGY